MFYTSRKYTKLGVDLSRKGHCVVTAKMWKGRMEEKIP